MGASHTLPRPDPPDRHTLGDLASEALGLDPDDWHPAHALAHLAVDHPRVPRDDRPDDDPFATHQALHQQRSYDHAHPARAGSRAAFDRRDPDRARSAAADDAGLGRQRAAEQAAAARAERFADLNPDFAVLPDDRDPAQHRFAADREQALALGTRATEAMRTENQGRSPRLLVEERTAHDDRIPGGALFSRPFDALRGEPERARRGPER